MVGRMLEHGRVITFTWPELSYRDLDRVRAEVGIKTAYPRVDPLAFLKGEFTVTGQVAESPDVRITVDKFEAYNEQGVAFIELHGEEIRGRILNPRLSSGQVSEWAERVVVREIGGFRLAVRGHTLHVRGEHADRLDALVAALVAVSGGRERVQVFKTVDTDPTSRASLVSAIRAYVEDAIEDGERRVAASRTSRGINGVLDGLRAVRAEVEAYRGLLGSEIDPILNTLRELT